MPRLNKKKRALLALADRIEVTEEDAYDQDSYVRNKGDTGNDPSEYFTRSDLRLHRETIGARTVVSIKGHCGSAGCALGQAPYVPETGIRFTIREDWLEELKAGACAPLEPSFKEKGKVYTNTSAGIHAFDLPPHIGSAMFGATCEFATRNFYGCDFSPQNIAKRIREYVNTGV